MPSNYTQNYQLSQWEATDQVCRTDFNSDNAKIDAAIAAAAAQIPKIAVGTYVGTCTTTGINTWQDIEVGFQPKAVFVTGSNDIYYFNGGAFITRDVPVERLGNCIGRITETGFTVGTIWNGSNSVNPSLNFSSKTYQYLAIG